jgi:hypothetical protein
MNRYENLFIICIVGFSLGMSVDPAIDALSKRLFVSNLPTQDTKYIYSEKTENDNFSSMAKENLLIAKREMELIKHKSDQLLECMKEMTINLEKLEKEILNTNGLYGIIY